MFNAPRVVLVLGAVNVVVWLLLAFGPAALRNDLFRTFAVFAVRDSGFELRTLVPLLGYQFLHADFTHVAFNMLFMLAFGTPVQRRLGTARFLAFYLLCGIAGGALFVLINPSVPAPLIGASGAVSGLMGGVVHFGFGGGPAGRRRVLAFVGIWLGLNLLFGLIGGALLGGSGAIAWEAHLGGFLAGLALFRLFDRGGRPRRPRHLRPVE